MIMPDKCISEEQSLLHLGGVLISLLYKPLTISELWENVKDKTHMNSFGHFVLTLDMLFIIGVIVLENDKIKLERKR